MFTCGCVLDSNAEGSRSMVHRHSTSCKVQFPNGAPTPAFRLEEIGSSISDSHFVWDLTNNVDWTFWKAEDYKHKLPCLLKKHTYWHVSKRRLGLSPSPVSFIVGQVTVT